MKHPLIFLKISVFCLLSLFTFNGNSQTLSLVVDQLDSSNDSIYPFTSVSKISFEPGNMVVHRQDVQNNFPLDNVAKVQFDYINIGIQEKQNIDANLVYPNPVENVVYLKFSQELNNNFPILILNAQGSVVKQLSTSFGSVQEINLSELKSGMYFIQIIGTDFISSSMICKK